MPSESFEAMIRQQEHDRARRLAFIRRGLTPHGGTWTGPRGLIYHAHRNTHPTRDKYPWQLTVLGPLNGTLAPYSHTEHEALDLDEDRGPYYRSVTHELTYSVTIPDEEH